MSTITGNVIDIKGAATSTSLRFVALHRDVVAGYKLVKSGETIVRSAADGSFSIVLAAGDYEVFVNKSDRYVINVPDDTATYAFADRITESATLASIPPGSLTPGARLIEMTEAGSFVMTTVTYSSGVITGATVRWPDGATGTLVVTSTSASGLINGFTLTHSLTNKTVTQPAVTRDANDDITVQPTLTVS